MHGDCRFHVVVSVVRPGVAKTIGPLWFPFRVMVDVHRAVVFAFQVAGSRFQGRLSSCVSRLASRGHRWAKGLNPCSFPFGWAALPPRLMPSYPPRGLMFRFFFQGLLSLGHLGALLQIRLPGYHLRIRDFKELRGQRTGQGQDPRSRLPGSAGCHSLTTIMESPFGHRQG